ncbi:hypothetical protein [Paludisphaera borealis]|uniref:hypothetical protein n=1 Tax=Paludisphaera borealis TaxID=1387353 RepID=UPI0011AB3EA5|nr:hypothetical protein [Paludisphaera borealis]
MPEKGDICDWLVAANAEGKTKEWCRCELERLAVHPVEPTPAQRVEEARREIVEDNSEIEDDPTMDDILAIDRGNEGRPSIEITCEQTEVNDQAIAALARDPNVFTIGGKIAVVAKMPPPRGVKDSPDGFKRICILDLPALEERMSASAYWHTSRIDKKGEVHQSQELPPGWSVKQVFSRPHKAGIPQVEGMVETPVLRPDGSIHETPGYDPATWTFFSPNAEFLPVPDAPTREDAIRAKDVLLELVTDFPFKDDANRAVWLAAALTPIARPAITEACPAFVFDAPEAGTGKSKLCDLISIIASGTEMPRSPWPGGRDVDDEVRKTLTAIAISGDRFTLWDNVPEGCKFGCASLDNAVTSITYKARVLGSSKLTDALPWRTITYATGNNMTLGNDTVRRTLISRIEADVERPCDREGFVFPRLIAHAKANRAKYVQAALTILKAHAVAGRPQLAKELGSFEEWSTVVASAVAWVMGVDPISVQKAGASRAPATSNRKILFDGLLEVNADVQEFTAADMLTKAEQLKTVGRPEDGPMYPSLYEFVEEFLDLPSRSTAKRKLFAALEKNEGKVVGGHKLVLREGRAHSKLWRLTEVKDGKTRPEEPSDESQMVSMVNMVTSSRRSIVRENSSPVFSYGPAGGEAHHAHHAHHLTPVGRSAPTCGDQAQPFQQATALPLSLNASGLPYDPNDWTTFG